jgi:hypothetical protein
LVYRGFIGLRRKKRPPRRKKRPSRRKKRPPEERKGLPKKEKASFGGFSPE